MIAFLILDQQEEYSERVGGKEVTLPTKLEKPTKEPTANSSLVELHLIERAEEPYIDCEEIDQKVKELIQTKFPKSLRGLKDEDGNLPLGLDRSKTAIQHI